MLPQSNVTEPYVAFRTVYIQDDVCCNEFEVCVFSFTAVQEVPQRCYYRAGEEDRDGCQIHECKCNQAFYQFILLLVRVMIQTDFMNKKLKLAS